MCRGSIHAKRWSHRSSSCELTAGGKPAPGISCCSCTSSIQQRKICLRIKAYYVEQHVWIRVSAEWQGIVLSKLPPPLPRPISSAFRPIPLTGYWILIKLLEQFSFPKPPPALLHYSVRRPFNFQKSHFHTTPPLGGERFLAPFFFFFFWCLCETFPADLISKFSVSHLRLCIICQ